MFFTVYKKENGVAALEFILVVPILMAFLLGCIEYGRFFKTRMAYDNALTAAVRTVAMNQGDPSPALIARFMMEQALSESYDLSQVMGYLTVRKLSDPARVEIVLEDVPYTPLTGLFSDSMLPATFSLKKTMVYQYSHIPAPI